MRDRRGDSAGDEGAAAVEFALLFPIFVVLVLGAITAGTAFSKQINITQAARETSRFGATLTFASAGGDVSDWLEKVSAVGQDAAGSSTDPIGGHDELCVALVDVSSPSSTSNHMIDGDGVVQSGACPGTTVNADLGPRYVQVVLKRDTTFFAVFVDADLTLDSTSTTPYEPGNAP